MGFSLDYFRELIYLVVDGQATEDEKKILFSQLAIDSDLQKEFDEVNLYNKAVVSNLDNAFNQPQKAVSESLFKKLGLVYSMNNLDNSKTKKDKSIVAIFLLLFSFGLSTLFINSMLFDENILSKYEDINFDKKIDKFDFVKNNTNSNKVLPTQNKINYGTNYTKKASYLINDGITKIYSKFNDDIKSVNEISASENLIEATNHNIELAINNQNESINLDDRIKNVNKINNNFSLRIEKLAGLATSGIDYTENDEKVNGFSSFGNFVISCMYQFESGLNIGLSIGNEFMPLYIKKEENYEISNKLSWIGARVELPLIKINDKLFVNGTATLASNISGPYSRLGIIADYSISDNISIGLNCNAGGLLYTNNGNYYVNTIINYGININFKF